MGSRDRINAGRPVAITKTHAAATLGFMDTVANRCSDSAYREILSVWRVDSSGRCRSQPTPHGRKFELAGSPASGPLPFCLVARTTAIRNFWEVVLSARSRPSGLPAQRRLQAGLRHWDLAPECSQVAIGWPLAEAGREWTLGHSDWSLWPAEISPTGLHESEDGSELPRPIPWRGRRRAASNRRAGSVMNGKMAASCGERWMDLASRPHMP